MQLKLQSVSRAKGFWQFPKENVFARNKLQPRATGYHTRRGGLGQGEVDAIVDIVASCARFEPSRVTVTDSNGRLLNSGAKWRVCRARRELELVQQKKPNTGLKLNRFYRLSWSLIILPPKSMWSMDFHYC